MAPAGGQYKTLGDDPSQIGPPHWSEWDDAFRRLCNSGLTSEDARDAVRDLVRGGRSAFVHVNSNAEETDVRFFPGTISGPVDADQVEPRVEIDAHGVEHLVPYQIYRPPIGSGCPDYSDGHTTFWVLTADIEKEERPYLTTAAPPESPAVRQKPESESRRSETAPRRFSAWAAEYKKGLNGANPAMDRFIAFTRDKYGIKGHRPELRDAYKELFPDQKPGRPSK